MLVKTRTVLVAALVIAVAVAGGMARRGPVGQATASAAVDEYLGALDDGDRARLRRVADPDHDAAEILDDRIDELGHGKLTVDNRRVPDGYHVVIAGQLDGRPYTETLTLTERGGRWYVVLGPDMRPTEAPTLSP